MEHLFTTPYMPFTVSLLVMFGIGIIEAIGLGLSAIDIDIGLDHGHDADISEGGVLSFLGIGEVPLIMLLVVFLTLFGVSGYAVQSLSQAITEAYASLWIAVPVAFVMTIPLLGVCGRAMKRLMPTDETTIISQDNMLGKRATIMVGTAEQGKPARALLRDHHGQSHYVLVEPDTGKVSEGEEIILVRKEGDVFVGTLPYSSELRPTI